MEFLLILFVSTAAVLVCGAFSLAFMYVFVTLVMRFIEKKIDKEDNIE